MKHEITYTEHNGLYYPDLALPEQTNYTLGKHSNLRIEFIKKHRRGTYTTLLTQGRLNEYLRDIDKQSHELISSIMTELAKTQGINENLKATDQMMWVQSMNNIRYTAEEIVMRELIFK